MFVAGTGKPRHNHKFQGGGRVSWRRKHIGHSWWLPLCDSADAMCQGCHNAAGLKPQLH